MWWCSARTSSLPPSSPENQWAPRLQQPHRQSASTREQPPRKASSCPFLSGSRGRNPRLTAERLHPLHGVLAPRPGRVKPASSKPKVETSGSAERLDEVADDEQDHRHDEESNEHRSEERRQRGGADSDCSATAYCDHIERSGERKDDPRPRCRDSARRAPRGG